MSHQLSLFGKPTTTIQPIFKKPAGKYELVVNKYWKMNHAKFYSKKKECIEEATKFWYSIKADEEKLKNFLEEKSPLKGSQEKLTIKTEGFFKYKKDAVEQVKTSESDVSSSSSSKSPCPSVSPFSVENAVRALGKGREDYITSYELSLFSQFVQSIIPSSYEKFLTDDVLNDVSFIRQLLTFVYDYGYFKRLKTEYASLKTRNKVTKLSKLLDELKQDEVELGKLFDEAAQCNLGKNNSSFFLAKSYLVKSEILKQIVIKSLQLHTKLKDNNVLNGLRRRINQQNCGMQDTYFRRKDEIPTCFCKNNCNLTWETAIDNILEMQNSGEKAGSMDIDKLINVSSFLKNEVALYAEELLVTKETECDTILKFLPVMVVCRGDRIVFINLHELVLTPGCLEAFLVSSDADSNKDVVEEMQKENEGNISEGQESVKKRGMGGQPSIVSKFPEIVNIAADFVKLNGYAAEARRRNETGSCPGVSIKEVREHLLQNVEGLAEHGISCTTVRRLFQPPNKAVTNSLRYKGFVDAKVGGRDSHIDSHYIFARNKYRKELAAAFPDRFCVVSMDDKAKVHVGTPAVSRFHQILKLFPSDDRPNFKDHDFPLPGYLLNVSGYMLLEPRESQYTIVNTGTHEASTRYENEERLDDIDEESRNLFNQDTQDIVQSGNLGSGSSYVDSGMAIAIQSSLIQEQQEAMVLKEHDERLAELLKLYNLYIPFEGKVPADGNCFFGALAHQIKLFSADDYSSQELRKLVVSELQLHPELYKDFLSDVEDIEAVYGKGLEELSKDGAWDVTLSNLVLLAAANVFRCQFIIFTSDPRMPYIEVKPTNLQPEQAENTYYLSLRKIPGKEHFESPVFNQDRLSEKLSCFEFENSVHVSEQCDNIKFDKLGRPHFGTPYSGPTVITVRAQKFFSATIQSHSNDLYPLLEAQREQGRTCCFLMVDGGPDYQTKSLLNELFYYRIWKKLNLDLLGAFCYPAGQSAYNCIEHFWSVGSKALAGVVFSATLPGEDLPPARQLISKEERKAKEAKLFNIAMDKLCNDYWKDISFDKFKVQSYPVHCEESFVDNAIFNDHTAVKNFLAAPLRDYHKFKDIHNELKHMLRHIDRHANEVIFMKCSDPSCCKEWEAKDVYRFLCKQGLRLPAPKMSKTHPGHYMTFMEVSALSKEETVNGDSGQPSVEKANLGKCNICPAYCYSSKQICKDTTKLCTGAQKITREDNQPGKQ